MLNDGACNAGHAAPSGQVSRVLDSLRMPIVAVDSKWRVTYANHSATELLNPLRSTWDAEPLWDQCPQLVGSALAATLHAAMHDKCGRIEVVCGFSADKWLEVQADPLADGGLVIVLRDITARIAKDSTLRESEAHAARQGRLFEQIAQTTPDFIYVFDLDGRFLYANRRLLEVWGRTFEQAVGRSPIELGYPQWHADMHLRELAQVVSTRQPIKGEVAFTGGSGIFGVYEYIFTPVLGPDGEVEVIAGTTRDVTERGQTQRELQQAKAEAEAGVARWLAVVNNMADGVVVSDANGHLYEWNAAALSMHGYQSLDEVRRHLNDFPAMLALSTPTGDFVPFEQWPMSRVLRGESFAGVELVIRRRDVDLRRVISYSGRAIRDREGNVVLAVLTLHDVTEERRAQAAMRDSDARLRLTTDALPVLISYIDAGQRYRFNNAAYLDWFGITPRDLAGRSVWEVVGEPAYENRRPFIERALLGERVQFEDAIHHKSLGSRHTETSYIPDFSDDGRTVRGFVALVYDITERRAAEHERERLLDSERAARSEAERQSRLKDEFLATLSHELRTPLNAILGWAQILRSGMRNGVGDDMLTGIEVIERNARSQTRIIEDLLDMSRIIAGKVRLDVQRVELGSVIEAAVQTVQYAADAKGVTLLRDLGSQPQSVTGDSARLQQVFWNLLNNSVKHCGRGGHVQVSVHEHSGNVVVTVADNGDGIPGDFLPHVFDRFRQADATTTRRHGGLGLGLSIVKQMVELHGGSVRAESAGIGQGATFVVTLPLANRYLDRPPAKANGPSPCKVSPDFSAAAVTLDGMHVLVVDDEPDARALVCRLLHDRGADVTSAASATEALTFLKKQAFDILVSDIGMPAHDGCTLIRWVRGLPPAQGGAVPAIALTAYARPEDRTRVLLAGYQMHMTKPVEPDELAVTIASLTRR